MGRSLIQHCSLGILGAWEKVVGDPLQKGTKQPGCQVKMNDRRRFLTLCVWYNQGLIKTVMVDY